MSKPSSPAAPPPTQPDTQAARLLERAASTTGPSERAALAEQLAAALLEDAHGRAGALDRARAARLARLMGDRAGQRLVTALTDRVFRSADTGRIAGQVAALVARFGTPAFMGPLERAALALARPLASLAAPLVAGGVLGQVRRESRGLVLEQRAEALSATLAARHRAGVRVNLNQLGEALLGERDAAERVARYEALAQQSDVDALSVKVSSMGSWLTPLAFEADARRLAGRLAGIYRASLRGSGGPRVVLDMEAYDDVGLTLTVLERALASEGAERARAGVVLQAYLPDAHRHVERLLALGRRRAAAGLPPLRVRLVKGANLAYERVEAARRGLPLPIFGTKVESDASYKLLLERLVGEGLGRGLELGVASHNVFDVAYALVLRAGSAHAAELSLEMLEGMAMPLLYAVVALGAPVLSYVPICEDAAMVNGIAYLVRRLDENTSPDNFLHHSFGMRAGDAAFELERQRFRAALTTMPTLDTRSPRRDTGHDGPRPQRARGEPDTDFADGRARARIAHAIADVHALDAPLLRSSTGLAPQLPGPVHDGFDPSRPGVVPYRVELLTRADVGPLLARLSADPRGFGRSSLAERSALLGRIAEAMRKARSELTAAMVMDSGKRVVEADLEVSEAIDFAEYYRRSFSALAARCEVSLSPRGVVLVAPPWNFPLAIPAGSVFGALMAGNRVVLKPAMETPYVASVLTRLLRRAGVSADMLALVLCDDDVASELVTDARTDAVLLTGATSTARLLQRLRPGLQLSAETGGKNAYIVSALSDREQAVRDVVVSAFGHAGQKCSATSLLILEREVYDDPHFARTLEDAVRSLPIGPAHAPESFVTPLIAPPSPALARAMDELAPGERWLVAPRRDPHNPRLVGPAVKWGVTAHSPDYGTELFGPVLAVMRADSLDHALALANGTGYGLTAGLASLDEREQARFLAELRAGNLYVNRTTTGAIVERQPFGGYANSSFGSGAKAGGPNYVLRLCRWGAPPSEELRHGPLPAALAARVRALAAELSAGDGARLRSRALRYHEALDGELGRTHDPHRVLGQHNLFRYRPRPHVLLRAAANARPLDVASTLLAAELAGCTPEVSLDPRYRGASDAALLGSPIHVESAAALVVRAKQRQYVRAVGETEPALRALGAELGSHVTDEPVLAEGRLELLHYLAEQSLSIEAHRHGYLEGDR